MTGALRYEWVRIRTIASSYWLAGMAIFLSAAVCSLLAITVTASDIEEANIEEVTTWIISAGASFAVMPVLSAAFAAVIGAMAMGHEYRYGTNKATLSALPDRATVLVAKLLMIFLWVSVTVAVTLLLNVLLTWLFMESPTFGSGAVRPLLNYWGYCVGFGLAGFGLSAIFRNQTGAIVAVLVWPFVIEPIINGVLLAVAQSTYAGVGKIANLLPASAGRRSLFDPYDVFAGFGQVPTWGVGASTLVFWLGVLVLVVGGSVLFVTRDA